MAFSIHSTPKEVNTLRKRNYRVGVRFNQAEHERFQMLVKDSGLSQEEYLRQLVRGVVPRDEPPPDYYKKMRQLYHMWGLWKRQSMVWCIRLKEIQGMSVSNTHIRWRARRFWNMVW